MAQKIWIVGIEGAGTSALALVYAAAGYDVAGSDDGDGFYRQALVDAGVRVFPSFQGEHVPLDVDFAVRSTAFGEDHVEVAKLREHGVRVLTYPEAVGELTREYETICVCGTHGKTTTSALMTHALVGAGEDPTAIVGAPVVTWQGGACIGSSELFVLEADEYQDKLSYYLPAHAIVTNVHYDHPDFFADEEVYRDVFRAFVARVPQDGVIVAYADDEGVRDIVERAQGRVVTYGTSEGAAVRMVERTTVANVQEITVRYKEREYMIKTVLFGEHNALNAVAAWAMAVERGADPERAAAGVATCRGAARRFTSHGIYNGAVMMDDYAHHPDEVRATLTAAREVWPERRLVVAFHPHTFTRTKELLEDFAESLAAADNAIILDIYGSAREEAGGVHAKDLVDAIEARGASAEYVSDIAALAAWARTNLNDDEVFFSMGAGDVWKVHELLEK